MVGALLAPLVAADAPALEYLNLCVNSLGDDALAPLVDALPRNRHLRRLWVSHNGLTQRFAAERLLPAVRANTSLRELHTMISPEADALVKQRAYDSAYAR